MNLVYYTQVYACGKEKILKCLKLNYSKPGSGGKKKGKWERNKLSPTLKVLLADLVTNRHETD